MKRTLITTTALLVAVFGVTLPARADRIGFQFGIAGGNGFFSVGYRSGGHKHHKHARYRKHSRRPHAGRPYAKHRWVRARLRPPVRCAPPRVHTCVRTPVYRQVWVEPAYRMAFDGLDARGRPRYRRVMVRSGYYRQVVAHYVCRHCGVKYH